MKTSTVLEVKTVVETKQAEQNVENLSEKINDGNEATEGMIGSLDKMTGGAITAFKGVVKGAKSGAMAMKFWSYHREKMHFSFWAFNRLTSSFSMQRYLEHQPKRYASKSERTHCGPTSLSLCWPPLTKTKRWSWHSNTVPTITLRNQASLVF